LTLDGHREERKATLCWVANTHSGALEKRATHQLGRDRPFAPLRPRSDRSGSREPSYLGRSFRNGTESVGGRAVGFRQRGKPGRSAMSGPTSGGGVAPPAGPPDSPT